MSEFHSRKCVPHTLQSSANTSAQQAAAAAVFRFRCQSSAPNRKTMADKRPQWSNLELIRELFFFIIIIGIKIRNIFIVQACNVCNAHA